MARRTLRQLNGFDETPARLGDSTLIMIDFQNTYTQGVMELEGWQQAIDAAAKLLKRAREAGATVIHIVNDGGVALHMTSMQRLGRFTPRWPRSKTKPSLSKLPPMHSWGRTWQIF